MKKLHMILALFAVGCLTLAGTAPMLAQTSDEAAAQVDRPQARDGQQDEDRPRTDRPRDRRRHRPDRTDRRQRPDRPECAPIVHIVRT